MSLSYERRVGNRERNTEKKQRYVSAFCIIDSTMMPYIGLKGEDLIFYILERNWE
ncbi:hypothetical protein I260019D6_12580 [Dorea longicatena]